MGRRWVGNEEGEAPSPSHAPAEMADQFVVEKDIFFLRAAADIVDDERVAIGGDLVRNDADMREISADERGEYIARLPILGIVGER